MTDKQQVGVILPYLAGNQAAFFAINEMNLLVTQTGYDAVLFFEEMTKPIVRPLFAIMNCSEMLAFQGLLIATTIQNAHKMVNMVCPAKKILYLWDLTWLRNEKEFIYNTSVLTHPHIELVARSQDHADMIKKYCNREVSAIVDDFNMKSFIDLFSGKIPKTNINVFPKWYSNAEE